MICPCGSFPSSGSTAIPLNRTRSRSASHSGLVGRSCTSRLVLPPQRLRLLPSAGCDVAGRCHRLTRRRAVWTVDGDTWRLERGLSGHFSANHSPHGASTTPTLPRRGSEVITPAPVRSAAADRDVVTGLAHQHAQLAHPTIDHTAVKVKCGTPSSPARSRVARASPQSGRETRDQRHRAGQAAASAGQVHELQLDVVRIAEHQGGVGDRLLHVDHAGVAHPERV